MDGGDGTHDYVCFRKMFRLDHMPETPVVHITAEQEYVLWINGAFAGRGPALSDPRFKRYDSFHVGNLLREGENVIAALVYHHCEVHGSRRFTPYVAGEENLIPSIRLEALRVGIMDVKYMKLLEKLAASTTDKTLAAEAGKFLASAPGDVETIYPHEKGRADKVRDEAIGLILKLQGARHE